MKRLVAGTLIAMSLLAAMAVMPPCRTIVVGDARQGVDSIRGPWELTGQDVIFELVKSNADAGYDFVIIDSDGDEVESGRVKGHLKPLVDDHRFDLYLESTDSRGRSKQIRAFIVTFAPDWSRLTLHAYNRHRKIRLDRLFPYMFRLGLSNENPRPNDIDGAVNLNFKAKEAEIVL